MTRRPSAGGCPGTTGYRRGRPATAAPTPDGPPYDAQGRPQLARPGAMVRPDRVALGRPAGPPVVGPGPDGQGPPPVHGRPGGQGRGHRPLQRQPRPRPPGVPVPHRQALDARPQRHHHHLAHAPLGRARRRVRPARVAHHECCDLYPLRGISIARGVPPGRPGPVPAEGIGPRPAVAAASALCPVPCGPPGEDRPVDAPGRPGPGRAPRDMEGLVPPMRAARRPGARGPLGADPSGHLGPCRGRGAADRGGRPGPVGPLAVAAGRWRRMPRRSGRAPGPTTRRTAGADIGGLLTWQAPRSPAPTRTGMVSAARRAASSRRYHPPRRRPRVTIRSRSDSLRGQVVPGAPRARGPSRRRPPPLPRPARAPSWGACGVAAWGTTGDEPAAVRPRLVRPVRQGRAPAHRGGAAPQVRPSPAGGPAAPGRPPPRACQPGAAARRRAGPAAPRGAAPRGGPGGRR